ncbi:MAG: hypothetical protein K9L28_06325 [Synergistales bacterium]|nr:hypothetical protein [Synergistales bacterium]
MARVMVCGCEGSGRSTVVSLLARYQVAQGWPVLVIDGDWNNDGLPGKLGLPFPERTLVDELGGFSGLNRGMLRWREGSGSAEYFQHQYIHVDDLPLSCVSRKDNFALIATGKIEACGEGCEPFLDDLSWEFLENLEHQGWWVFVDTGEGMDRLEGSVGTVCEAILHVMRPEGEDLCTTLRIREILQQAGLDCMPLLNNIDEERIEEVRAGFAGRGLPVELALPRYEALSRPRGAESGHVQVQPEMLPYLDRIIGRLRAAIPGNGAPAFR